jgi:hypothetical protein
MSSKLLDIAQTAAHLADFPGCTGYKLRRPLWLEQPIIPRPEYTVEPDGDGSRREAPIALTMDYR